MEGYEISTNQARLNIEILHAVLLRLYACEASSSDVLTKAVANSLNFAAYSSNGELAAYARVVSDNATFAHIADAFVTEPHRGRGLSKLVLDAVTTHPDLKGVRLYFDAHSARGFYEHSGFALEPRPMMQLRGPL